MMNKEFWLEKTEQKTFDQYQLRVFVGILAFALPIVVSLGYLIFCNEKVLFDSISDYYHSEMRNYFVGTLCAIGVIFLSYYGYARIDRILADAAAVCAFVVAFFPNHIPECGENCRFGEGAFNTIGIIHLSSAAILFLILATFCLFLFTKSNKTEKELQEAQYKAKRRRNLIYRICGWTILISMAILGLSFIIPFLEELRINNKLIFWMEAIMLWAFGISWLTKGEIIFGD